MGGGGTLPIANRSAPARLLPLDFHPRRPAVCIGEFVNLRRRGNLLDGGLLPRQFSVAAPSRYHPLRMYSWASFDPHDEQVLIQYLPGPGVPWKILDQSLLIVGIEGCPGVHPERVVSGRRRRPKTALEAGRHQAGFCDA